MINELFDRTLKTYKISAKELSKTTGVSESHISDFRKGKRSVTTEVLERLMNGMDSLSVGSKKHLCELMAGEKIEIASFIETATEKDLEEFVLQIIRKLFPKNKPETNDSNDKNASEYMTLPLFK